MLIENTLKCTSMVLIWFKKKKKGFWRLAWGVERGSHKWGSNPLSLIFSGPVTPSVTLRNNQNCFGLHSISFIVSKKKSYFTFEIPRVKSVLHKRVSSFVTVFPGCRSSPSNPSWTVCWTSTSRSSGKAPPQPSPWPPSRSRLLNVNRRLTIRARWIARTCPVPPKPVAAWRGQPVPTSREACSSF